MIIQEFNSSISMKVDEADGPVTETLRRALNLLDDDETFAYSLFWTPDDAGWPDAPGYVESEWAVHYLQAGGVAHRMGVELRRREDDGEDRFYVVGRAHDLGEPRTEVLDVQNAHEQRHPAELFTAEQALPVFSHYYEHRTVPDGYTLRLIADM